MGAVSAAVGAIVGFTVLAAATGDGYGWFVAGAPVGAFLAGFTLWWLLVARGALVGALAGAVGHYCTWYVLFLSAAVCHAVTGGCTGSLGEPPVGPFAAIGAAAIYSVFSLLFFGWLTIPVGAVLGGLLARTQRSASSSDTVTKR